MSNSDKIKVTDDEALRKAERTLDGEVTLCIAAAETAFKHALNFPTASALAGVDRVINLFKRFLSEAEPLKAGGHPAVHNRVTLILSDLTATRATLTQTVRGLNAADLKDTTNLATERAKWEALQKGWIDSRLAQGQIQAAETRKLL